MMRIRVASPPAEESRCDFGATAIDTDMASATPASPAATIGSADYGRNRMGVKCCWAITKCLFGGTKSERRFKFRHMQDVSSRALQGLQLFSHGIGPEVEVGSVPGRNAGAQDDGLG